MQRSSGFTLLELVTTTAVLAVVLALAIPAFQQLRRSVAISAAFHELTASLANARLLAVARGVPVTVCPSQDGRNCRKDRVWDDGWITFLDAARRDNPLSESDVVHRYDSSGAVVAIRSTAGRHWLRFHPSGLSPGTNQSLWFCGPSDGRRIGRVVVNNGGRIRSERDDDDTATCPFP